MKTKSKKIIKSFDAVKSMREIRDKISLEIADMNFEQLKTYFKKQSRLVSGQVIKKNKRRATTR